MKQRILFTSLMLILLSSCFVACSKDEEGPKNQEFSALFSKTDYYVNKLDISGSGGVDSSESSDGKYLVTLMGRLITVKKNYSSGATYYEIKDALQDHYKNNPKVDDIYINKGGTVTIDCR